MRRTSTALALLGSCTLLAACGGDDGGEPLSAGDYRAQLGAICTEAEKKAEAAEQADASSGTDGKALKAAFDARLPALDESLDEIDELSPPEELEGAHDEYLKATREGVDTIQSTLDDIDEDKPLTEQASVIQGLTPKLEALSTRTDAAAKKLGVAACS